MSAALTPGFSIRRATPAEREVDPKLVPCPDPTCGARRGEMCVSLASGRELPQGHAVRQIEARKASR